VAKGSNVIAFPDVDRISPTFGAPGRPAESDPLVNGAFTNWRFAVLELRLEGPGR
jgi:hypothetical protein